MALDKGSKIYQIMANKPLVQTQAVPFRDMLQKKQKMKKLIFTIATAFAFAGSISAQDVMVVKAKKDPSYLDIRNRFVIGGKAGFNYSNVYATSGQDFKSDPRFGLALGGFVSIPIITIIGIQPEVMFSQKGFHAKGSFLGSPYDLTRTTNYIDVPIFFAFKPSQFITLLAGPQYSYLTKQKDVFANATTTIEQERQFENDNLRKNILSLAVGVDINLAHLVVSARGGWDMQNNNGDGSTSTPRYKNEWLQCTLGYRIFY
jgi:hypothetical protein